MWHPIAYHRPKASSTNSGDTLLWKHLSRQACSSERFHTGITNLRAIGWFRNCFQISRLMQNGQQFAPLPPGALHLGDVTNTAGHKLVGGPPCVLSNRIHRLIWESRGTSPLVRINLSLAKSMNAAPGISLITVVTVEMRRKRHAR